MVTSVDKAWWRKTICCTFGERERSRGLDDRSERFGGRSRRDIVRDRRVVTSTRPIATAANALSAFVIKQTTSLYTEESIAIDIKQIRNLEIRMASVRARIRSFGTFLSDRKSQPLQKLLIVGRTADAQQPARVAV